MKRICITGMAGFIGFHLQERLSGKYTVTGIDSLDKHQLASAKRSLMIPGLVEADINSAFLDGMDQKPEIVIHLAANTGISESLTNPQIYFENNIRGTFNILEQCRKNGVKYLIYASSSSVYEPEQSVMSEKSGSDQQLSFYGTTKKMSEIMIENYCRQFGITAIGLRFFTVYGSWTRTDMAAYKFMQAIENDQPVTLYNDGDIKRDFTHVSDIVSAIDLLIEKIQTEQKGFHSIFNIGHGSPVSVKEYARQIAKNMAKELLFESKELPSNELKQTHCDTEKLEKYIQFKPRTSVEEGVKEMVEWYKTAKYV